MKLDVKWFVEIILARGQQSRVEVCGSLREAREIADRAEEGVDFDGTTDSIAIYRGESWETAGLYE